MSSSAITGPILSDVRRSPSGSAAAPSWSFAESTGTGVYLVSAGVLGLSTNGAQRVVVDASGNVGVGVTPSAWGAAFKVLQFGNTASKVSALFSNGENNTWYVSNTYFDGSVWRYISSSTATGYEQLNGAHKWYSAPSGMAGGTATFNQAMTLDASGTLSIGSTAVYGGLNVTKTGSLSPGVFIWVNATATTQKYMSFEYNGNGGSGSITPNGTGNVAFNTGPSDYRLKEEVKPFTSGLQKVLELKPVSFKWKESQKEDYGFIAHELQEVIPEAVTGQKDAVNEEGKPDYQAIFPAPAQMIANLVSAIQELKTELDEAKAKIAALEAK